jgi:hypothetical protein
MAELGSAVPGRIHDQGPGRNGASRLAALEYDWTGRACAGYLLRLLRVSFGAPEYLGGCRRLRRSLWWPQSCRPRSTSRHRLSRGGVVLKPLGDDSLRYTAVHPRAPAANCREPGAADLRPFGLVREQGPDRRRAGIGARGVELPPRARRAQSTAGRCSGTLMDCAIDDEAAVIRYR